MDHSSTSSDFSPHTLSLWDPSTSMFPRTRLSPLLFPLSASLFHHTNYQWPGRHLCLFLVQIKVYYFQAVKKSETGISGTSANYVQDSCRTLCVDSQSPITQKKPDNGRQRRIWNQITLIIPSSPPAHFLPFKPHIHDINSVEKEVKVCVMWTEQLVDSIFHFLTYCFVVRHSFSAKF